MLMMKRRGDIWIFSIFKMHFKFKITHLFTNVFQNHVIELDHVNDVDVELKVFCLKF